MKKVKKTNMEVYGVEYVIQNSEIQEKIKNTIINKYGVDHISKSPEIRKKAKQTNLVKYGVEFASQSPKIKEKVKQTNLERFGVEYLAQNPEIMDKISKKCYSRKTFTSKSGKQYICQGYEPHALKILTEELNIPDENILTGATNVPKIKYTDEEEIEHIHYPDIYLKPQNKLIEVKSTWTLKKKKDSVFTKQKAAKEQGFLYEIWVISPKGQILQKHI